jgi:hypothetical protein
VTFIAAIIMLAAGPKRHAPLPSAAAYSVATPWYVTPGWIRPASDPVPLAPLEPSALVVAWVFVGDALFGEDGVAEALAAAGVGDAAGGASVTMPAAGVIAARPDPLAGWDDTIW